MDPVPYSPLLTPPAPAGEADFSDSADNNFGLPPAQPLPEPGFLFSAPTHGPAAPAHTAVAAAAAGGDEDRVDGPRPGFRRLTTPRAADGDATANSHAPAAFADEDGDYYGGADDSFPVFTARPRP